MNQPIGARDRARRRRRLLAGVAVAGLFFAAAPAWAQSLEEAMAIAYRSNPELLAARASLRVTDEQLPTARGAWRPTVRATVSAGVTQIDAKTEGTTTVDDSSTPVTGSVSLSQPLYTGGGAGAGIREADANIQAQRASLFSTEQNVLLQVVTAYVDVIQAESTLDLRISNRDRLEKQLQATRDRFRVGEVTRTDVAQAESRLARAEADVTDAEGTLVTASVEFERVVGQVPQGLQQPSLASNLPQNRQAAVDAAVADNFTLVQAKFQEQSAAAAIDSALASLYPTLNLVGQADYSQDSAGQDNEQTQFSAELQLSIPLYQRGVAYSNVRQAKEVRNQARLAVDDQRRRVVDSAASTYEAFQTTLAQIESLRSEVSSAEIALDGVQQEATVGARTVLDVLDAEQELLDAQVSLVRATRDSIVASYQLLVAMGRLTAQDLGLPVEIYDYDSHYRAVEGRWFGTEPPGRLPGD